MRLKDNVIEDLKAKDKEELYQLLIEITNINDDVIQYLNNKHTIAVTDVDMYIEAIDKCFKEKRDSEQALEIYTKLRKTSIDYRAICQVGLYVLDEIIFDLNSNKSKQIVYKRIKKTSKMLCYDLSKLDDNYNARLEYESLMMTAGEYAYEYMLDSYYEYFEERLEKY